MSLYRTVALSSPSNRVPLPLAQDVLDINQMLLNLCSVCIHCMSSLTRPGLSNVFNLFLLLTVLSLGEALPLGTHPGAIQKHHQSTLAQHRSGRHLLEYTGSLGMLFPASLRTEGTDILITELKNLSQKEKGVLKSYFNCGTEVSDVKSDYILIAPAIFISLLNFIARLANDNPVAPGAPRFGGSCDNDLMNIFLMNLAPSFSQHMEVKEGLSRSLQNHLLLVFQNIFQNVGEFQANPSLLSLVITDAQLRDGFSTFSEALRNCSSRFIQPLEEINYVHLLSYQLAAITTSTRTALASAMASNSSKALQTALTSMWTSILSQPGTTPAVTSLASAPAEPTVSASGTTAAPTALVSATAAGLASAIAVLVATTPAAPNDPLFTSGAVPDSSTKNGPQLEYLALLSLLTIPLLLAFIRYVRRRAASEATKGPDSVSFSSRFSHVTAVTSGLSVLQVVTPDTLSEIVAATREEARAVARDEAVKVVAEATGLPGGVSRSQIRRNSI